MKKAIEYTCKQCGKKFFHKGKAMYCSKECFKKSRRGSGNPNWNGGKVERICKNCGKKFFVPKHEIKRYKNGASYCSKKCFGESILGKNNGNWKGGTFPYWNRRARILFGDKCQICGSKKYLCVHHIDGNRTNNPDDGSNWMLVCKSCHSKIHNTVKNLFKKEVKS